MALKRPSKNISYFSPARAYETKLNFKLLLAIHEASILSTVLQQYADSMRRDLSEGGFHEPDLNTLQFMREVGEFMLDAYSIK